MNLYKRFYALLAITLLLVTACTKEQVQPQEKLAQLPNSSEAIVKSSDCTPTFAHGSTIDQCTAGVRLWKGGVPKPLEGKVYKGVPWTGHAKDWWANAVPCAKRSSTPRKNSIVVFGAHQNSAYGHVGIVTGYAHGKYWMKSRNANGQGQDTDQTIESYVNANNAPILGYLVYPR